MIAPLTNTPYKKRKPHPMPGPAPETQALLDELQTPTHHTPAALKIWMRASAQVARLQGQEVALLRGLLQESVGEEPSPVIVGKMETLANQFDAQARILDTMAREGGALRRSMKDAGGLVGELRAMAAADGYMV